VDIYYIVMVGYVDKHRRKSMFQIGDLVKYKVSPYKTCNALGNMDVLNSGYIELSLVLNKRIYSLHGRRVS
jgi:hypothetical protein